MAVAGLVVAIAAVAAAALLLGDGEPAAPVTTDAGAVPVTDNSLVLIDAGDSRVVASVALGGKPTRVTYGEGAFWAVAPEQRLVVRVDAKTHEVRRLEVGAEPYDVAVGDGRLWVPDHDFQRLFRVEPSSGEVGETKAFGAPAVSVGYGLDAVWVIFVPGNLKRVDPTTGEVTATIENVAFTTERAEPKLVFTEDTVWVVSSASTSLARVGRDGKLRDQRTINGIMSATAVGEDIWLTNSAGAVWQLGEREETRVRVGYSPLDIAASDDALWVVVYEQAAIKRIDVDDSRVIANIKLRRTPVAVAAGGGLVAVAVTTEPILDS